MIFPAAALAATTAALSVNIAMTAARAGGVSRPDNRTIEQKFIERMLRDRALWWHPFKFYPADTERPFT